MASVTLFLGNIQCNRLEPPENAKIIYANERGIINNNLEKYSMGTFAEIQCDNDMVVDGENFLSCSETTLWDYPLPKCVVKVATESTVTQNLSIVSATNIYEMDDTSNEEDDDLKSTSKAPTLAFWQSLKKFLYQGCQSPQNISSELCWKTSKPIEFSDLSTYQPPETNEPMDRLLLGNLQRCVDSLNEFSQKLTFDNVFDCITDWNNPTSISNDLKDSLRLIISFYIDTVTTDTLSSTIKSDESITDKIKNHLNRIVTAVFQNYLRDVSDDSDETEDFTQMTFGTKSESQCNLMLIPTLPNNTIIKNVTNRKVKIFSDIDNIRMVPVFVPELSKVHFECVKGYQFIGKDYTECLFGEWTDIGFECERNY